MEVENNSKLKILNHRNRLLTLVTSASSSSPSSISIVDSYHHLGDITNDDDYRKRLKIDQDSFGSTNNNDFDISNNNSSSNSIPMNIDMIPVETSNTLVQTDPIDFIRNELLFSQTSLLIGSDMLRLKSNFDTRQDDSSSNSTSSTSSSSGTSSYLSSPRDGSISPQHHQQQDSSTDLDLNLNINLSSSLLTQQNQENTLFKPINNLLKYNLNYLHLIRKETLIFLIEQNFQNHIKSPFDLFAYNRLKTYTLPLNIDTKTTKYNYNYINIKKLSKLLSYYENPLDKKYLKQNMLLPCCISQFLMPFYFDIFKMSELNQFSQSEIDMVLFLKRIYKTQIYLDYESLIGNYKENILWNCFVLFKYKFSLSTFNHRMEFFNFYLSLNYSLQHLEHVVYYLQKKSTQFQKQNQILKDHIAKALDLSLTLPFLFDTLILTGMFKHGDYLKFKRFVQSRLFFVKRNEPTTTATAGYDSNSSIAPPSQDYLEHVYYENSLKSVSHKAEQCFPLKLKNLCRIKIKDQIAKYDSVNVNKLTILPKTMKSFLLYEDELKEFYTKYKNLVNQNSINFTSW